MEPTVASKFHGTSSSKHGEFFSAFTKTVTANRSYWRLSSCSTLFFLHSPRALESADHMGFEGHTLRRKTASALRAPAIASDRAHRCSTSCGSASLYLTVYAQCLEDHESARANDPWCSR
ncbi:hypothetical protein K523DRAFT_319573 [Schizophyllum commune Tattone D]|nr:hypothetical protein K523DRAFT_319573 [Schizophyllum commune Tattone D]